MSTSKRFKASSSSSGAVGSNAIQSKKKPIIHSQARELARKVLENCELERKNKCFKHSLNKSLDRAAYYTGLSKRTLTRIKSESKAVGSDVKLKSPKKRKKRGQRLSVYNFDRAVIHNTITEFYLYKKIIPTCPKLLISLKEKIPFTYGVRTLQRLLKKLGYRWRKSQNKRTVLIEKPDITYKRYQYIRSIKEFRQQNRNIFYLDETLIDNSLNFKKCWQKAACKGVITVNAGSCNGFIAGASMTFMTDNSSENRPMNGDNFEKWVTENLLPYLPPASVIVMDNAPYHRVQLNRPPTKTALRGAMFKWLEENNIPCNSKMRKPDLFKIIEQRKPLHVNYKIDTIFRAHGHEILRLPPHMYDLSPVELAWVKIKHSINKDYNMLTDLSLPTLHEVVVDALSKVTKEDWQVFDEHVQIVEQQYWTRDVQMENMMEDFNIEVRESSDEESASVCSELSVSSLEHDSD